MQQFSNRYIILYSTLLVVIAAIVLAVVSLCLKPYQMHNEQVEEMQMILRASGFQATRDNTAQLYSENITEATTPNGEEYYIHKTNGAIILPVRGTGLWGPIWGYFCLDSLWTIRGAVFDHKGETPGLGGEIATDAFAQRFVGKRVKDEQGHFHSIVLKKNANPQSHFEVDAISGGTMTSNGITQMIADCLPQYYDFLNATDQ